MSSEPTKPQPKKKRPWRVVVLSTIYSVIAGIVGGAIAVYGFGAPFYFGFFFGFTLIGMSGMFWLAVHMTDFPP